MTTDTELAAWRQELLRSVWDHQRERVDDRLQRIRDALDALAADSLEPDARAAATRAAHTLAGSLGIFGFTAAARGARELERGLPLAGRRDAPRLAALLGTVCTELRLR